MSMLDIFIGLLLLIFIIVSIGYAFIVLRQYFDSSAVYFFGVVTCFDAWIFTIALFFFFSPLTFPQGIQVVYTIGNIALLLGLIGFAYMMNHSIFSRTAGIFAKLSIFGYSMIIALNLVDLLLTEPIFFLIIQNTADWEVNAHPLATVLIIVTGFLLMLTVAINILNLSIIPENLVSQQKNMRYLLLLGIIVGVGVGIGAFISTSVLNLVSLKVSLILFVAAAFISILPLLYFSYTQPFFFLVVGMQSSRLLLEQGYVGYFLGSFTDYGPSPVLISAELKEQMNISDQILVNFSVSALSASSIYESLVGTFSLLPVPECTTLTALTFTFIVKNPKIQDERLIDGTTTFVAIMFPTSMLSGINNIAKIQPYIWAQLKEKETLSQVSDPEFLEKLTLFILRTHFI
ncbi:MAG: hypothetical protein ACFFC7_20015 [Candidatus Hermodarchaeota archaeon]